MSEQNADIAKLPFEQALAELESIVKALEAGNVPLEESIKLYERGEAAEARVEKITQGTDGKAAGTSPLDPA